MSEKRTLETPVYCDYNEEGLGRTDEKNAEYVIIQKKEYYGHLKKARMYENLKQRLHKKVKKPYLKDDQGYIPLTSRLTNAKIGNQTIRCRRITAQTPYSLSESNVEDKIKTDMITFYNSIEDEIGETFFVKEEGSDKAGMSITLSVFSIIRWKEGARDGSPAQIAAWEEWFSRHPGELVFGEYNYDYDYTTDSIRVSFLATGLPEGMINQKTEGSR